MKICMKNNFVFHGNFETNLNWQFLPEYRFFNLWQYLRETNPGTSRECLTGLAARLPEADSAIGYSMGGRILMQLCSLGWKVKNILLISTHPGLEDPKLRRERMAADSIWQARVLHESWTDVFAAWESQPVFETSAPGSWKDFRTLESFRLQISRGFEVAGLGAFLAPSPEIVFRNVQSIRLVYGEKDDRFVKLGEKFIASLTHPNAQLSIVKGVGHRVHLERPDLVREFLGLHGNKESP